MLNILTTFLSWFGVFTGILVGLWLVFLTAGTNYSALTAVFLVAVTCGIQFLLRRS